ncbi:hypothetical protein QA596_06760 [Balneolales bacterium ANBcel1]|nr:hypothetical protein [Balneolales bacterium ANBcel1]
MAAALLIANQAASAQWTMGARGTAMGQAHTALPSDPWSVFHNPAMIDDDNRYFALFAIRNFGMKELEDHAAVFSMPVLFNRESAGAAVSGGIHSYGFRLFRETRLLAGSSFRLHSVRVGLTATYVHTSIRNYGSGGSLVVNAGIASTIAGNLTIGFRWLNLFHDGLPFWSRDPPEVPHHPAEMAAGLTWRIVPSLLASFDLVNDVMHPITLRSGFEAEVLQGFFLRGGWTTRPFTWSAGAGFRVSSIKSSLAVRHHEVLGLSPGLGCTIFF